jgi:hypothetical protein
MHSHGYTGGGKGLKTLGAISRSVKFSLWYRSPALNDPNQNHNDGHEQKKVDEPAERVGSKQPQQPHN